MLKIMILRQVNFFMSIRQLKVSDFSFVHVVILLFMFCADYSITHAGQLPEKTPSINLTTEEKAWLKEHPEITIAHTFDWPPYSFLDSNSQPVGPSIDFFEIVAEMVGLKFKVHQDGLWNRIYEAGKNKEVDVVASMTITKERKQWFSFPRPYLFLSSYIVTRKDFQKIKHRDNLKGKKYQEPKVLGKMMMS
jgi:ABC-type amino acid transport substrate-binding protein